MPDFNSFQLDPLRKALKPFRLYFYTRLRSTNDHASKLRRAGKLYAPAVLVAARQTKGRGRGSNVWWSGPGSLTVTFVIPTDAGILPHQVPLIAGLAVLRATQKLTGNDAIRVKWPNDLLNDDLKLAGLLCERIDGADLIGLGLNVNVDIDDIPGSVRHRATSLSAIIGRQVPIQEALIAVAGELATLLLQKDFGSFSAILREYSLYHGLQNRMVRVTEVDGAALQGTCEGLDSDGRLLVRTQGRLARIVAGHVELL